MKISNASISILTSLVITSNIFADAAQQLRGHRGVVENGQWEAAPFMETGPFGLDSTHTFGFSLQGKAYAMTGNLRVPEFDYCGDCRGTDISVPSKFTDVYYSYDPTTGWTDLGPHPGGVRGYSQGDIMDRGTDNEILYWGLGAGRRIEDEHGDLRPIYPQWGFGGENRTEYGLQENRTGTLRLTDWWSFDGTDWKRLAEFPGIGRTHPAVAASDGKVFVGLGFGELCPSLADPCTATSYQSDPRGAAGNLQDVWVYDVQTDTWEEVEPFPYPDHHPMHFGLSGHNDQDPGGAFFMAGHNGAIVYNRVWKIVEQTSPDGKYNFTWTEMAPLPGLGRVAGTQFSHKGYGYVLGGETAANGNNLLDGFGNSGDYGLNVSALKEDHRSMSSNEFWKYVRLLAIGLVSIRYEMMTDRSVASFILSFVLFRMPYCTLAQTP